MGRLSAATRVGAALTINYKNESKPDPTNLPVPLLGYLPDLLDDPPSLVLSQRLWINSGCLGRPVTIVPFLQPTRAILAYAPPPPQFKIPKATREGESIAKFCTRACRKKYCVLIWLNAGRYFRGDCIFVKKISTQGGCSE
jgi:hypothetical protein